MSNQRKVPDDVKDAARYRWIRSQLVENKAITISQFPSVANLGGLMRPNKYHIDDCVDRAMLAVAPTENESKKPQPTNLGALLRRAAEAVQPVAWQHFAYAKLDLLRASMDPIHVSIVQEFIGSLPSGNVPNARAVAEKCAEIVADVGELTLFIGRPISSETEFHSVVRDLLFLKAEAIRAYAATLPDALTGNEEK